MAGKNSKPNIFVLYYDKFLVIVVLIVLLLSLGYLTTVAMGRKQNEQKYLTQLDQLKQTSENVKPMPMTTYEAAAKQLSSPMQLAVPEMTAATFLTPERRVVCEEPSCGKPILADAKTCPFCGKEQQVKMAEREDVDKDKDGIPDKIELAWGLDPENPEDAAGDLDGDGFSNLEEYLAKTDPKDGKAHPALVNLLRVKELRSKKLPVVLQGVNLLPGGKKQMVFARPGADRWSKNELVEEGQEIGKTGLKVVKFEYKLERRKDPRTGLPIEVNVSTAVLKRLSDNKEVTVVCGEPPIDTDVEAVIALPLDKAEYTVIEKSTFKVREETFRVISVDQEKSSVLIVNEATGQEKFVRKLD
ncbi:MAG: zinc ribbon domain-containing protein [Kiritimatiellae bacterium]|nr:zinc ribbon domain-containing protein [Kiritimatiellia bacterium]